MERETTHWRPGIPLWAVLFVVCSLAQVSTATACILRSVDLEDRGEVVRLQFRIDGRPKGVETKIGPSGDFELKLSGCGRDPEVTSRSFPSGLIAEIELQSRLGAAGPVAAVYVTARRPFEYSLNSIPKGVELELRRRNAPELAEIGRGTPTPVREEAPRETEATLEADPEPQAQVPISVLEPLESLPPSEEPASAEADSAAPESGGEETEAPVSTTTDRLIEGARISVQRAPVYDSSYRALDYPGGDPGWERGCGTDLVVRAFRYLEVDLQQRVHEDVLTAADAYGIETPNTNIDHRRVRNLALFFQRQGSTLPVDRTADWQGGDLVFWSKDGKDRPNHVGVVSDREGPNGHPLVLHHVEGQLPLEEDVLFAWPVWAHYRWLP